MVLGFLGFWVSVFQGNRVFGFLGFRALGL